jgi:opacity protein-like surface antigen
MNKFLIAAVGAALAAASATAAAADANGAFFINAGVGQGQYHVGRTDGLGYQLDDKDTAGALRAGYAWHVARSFDLGLEGGYVDLGKLTEDYLGDGVSEHSDLGVKGWLLGGNGKYNFADKWYVSARAGWFRSTGSVTYRYSDTTMAVYGSGDAHGDGWYGGVGVGYDFAPNFSLGLNYDNYHAKAKVEDVSAGGNIGSYMLTAEYRF